MKSRFASGRRVAVAISGGGRSLANFLGKPGAYEIAAVIASRPDCKGVKIANEHHLPLYVGDFSDAGRARTTLELEKWLIAHDITWVALAGFLKLYPVTPRWVGKVVNIHPALLPNFGGHGMYGDRVHAAAIAAQAQESGATVHFVDDRYDEGRIIAQVRVPVRTGDDPEALATRVFAAECRLYPHVLNGLVTGTLPLPAGKIERLHYDGD